MKVVDASVALKWFVEESDSNTAWRVLKGDLVAPSLILGEVANGLWKKWRQHEVTRDQALAAIASLPMMLVDTYPPERLVDRATQIALDVDHAVYDCFYLALAEQLRIPFVTADIKMINKFASTSLADLFEPLT